MTTVTGGCQCGRICCTTQIDTDAAYLSHCRICPRATGGVSIAFVGIAKAKVAWAREPDWYTSSPIARLPFCSVRGIPLGFAFPEGETMDLTVGSFDDPGFFRPTRHFGVERLHEAWIDTSALPRLRTDQNETVVGKWMDACGKLPD